MTDSARPAFLDPGELAELGPGQSRPLPVNLIDENPLNPRKTLVEVDQLAESIKEFGLLQPITVRRVGDRYELLGGQQRRAAFLLLQEQEPFEPRWRVIEAVIRTFDDDSAYRALLAGQLQTRSWNPREEAAALETLVLGRTVREVSAMVHRSESWVGRRLKAYSDSVLSGPVQSGRLAANVAHEFLVVTDPAVRRALAEQAVADHWGQAEARRAVRLLKTSTKVRAIGRLATALLEALALVQPLEIPTDTVKVLASLRGRLLIMGKGSPVLPTIEQAEKAAIESGAMPRTPRKRRQSRRKPGYVPRTAD